jgi:hypothetical protein
LTLPKDKLVGDAVTLPEAAVPSPVRATCCGLLPALSVKFSVAVRVPVAVGLKMMFAVQLEEAPRVEPHVLLKTSKSVALVPVKPMLLMVIAVLPELVRVTTFCPPALPMATLFQLSDVGDTVTWATAFDVHPHAKPKAAINTNVLIERQCDLHEGCEESWRGQSDF